MSLFCVCHVTAEMHGSITAIKVDLTGMVMWVLLCKVLSMEGHTFSWSFSEGEGQAGLIPQLGDEHRAEMP